MGLDVQNTSVTASRPDAWCSLSLSLSPSLSLPFSLSLSVCLSLSLSLSVSLCLSVCLSLSLSVCLSLSLSFSLSLSPLLSLSLSLLLSLIFFLGGSRFASLHLFCQTSKGMGYVRQARTAVFCTSSLVPLERKKKHFHGTHFPPPFYQHLTWDQSCQGRSWSPFWGSWCSPEYTASQRSAWCDEDSFLQHPTQFSLTKTEGCLQRIKRVCSSTEKDWNHNRNLWGCSGWQARRFWCAGCGTLSGCDQRIL